MKKIFLRAMSKLGRLLCRFRGNTFIDVFASGVDLFHRGLNNVDFDMASNGEMRVLDIISKKQPKCVFDVGANVGEWSLLVHRLNPGCVIHAFEIVPDTFNQLAKNTEGIPNVFRMNKGLSSESGMLDIYIGGGSETATAFKIGADSGHRESYKKAVRCETLLASEYIEANQISKIDFVKIDTEGMDLRVIKGFEDHIGKVAAIQFEYGIFNISSHDLLSDFCEYLRNKGFCVGKIFPNTVEFFDYNFHMENFHGSNFIAVNSSDKDLISALQ